MKRPTQLILTDPASVNYSQVLNKFNAGEHIEEHKSYREYFKDELPGGIDITILYNGGRASLRFTTTEEN